MLEGKVCFVSGAARGKGNGRAIALKLAGKGAHVATGDIRYEEAQGVAEEIRAMGRKSLAVKMDLGDYDQIKEGIDKIRKELGPVDVLVNNAAIMTNIATISAMKPGAWEKEIAVNLSGAFYCVKQVFDDMAEKKWGRIINMSSLAGRMGSYGGGVGYATTKAGIIGLTMCFARQVAQHNITVNAVAPGTTKTEIIKTLPEDKIEAIKAMIPMGRLGKPENTADVVTFLASDKAEYITGAVIDVNGGIFMG